MKNHIQIVCILAMLLFSCSNQQPDILEEPIVIEEHGLLADMTIDDLIKEAELIVIGRVDNVSPSKWKSPIGEVPENITSKEIFDADISIVTDLLFVIEKTLKGKSENEMVRIRTFIGEIDNVRFVSSSEPEYKIGQSYLLFLFKDNGPTQIVDPGDYIAVNAIDGVYQIIDGKAISVDDEWILEEFIAYIEKSLSETK